MSEINPNVQNTSVRVDKAVVRGILALSELDYDRIMGPEALGDIDRYGQEAEAARRAGEIINNNFKINS